jgi:hypothetical protein
VSASTTGSPRCAAGHQRLDRVVAADFQGHHGAEFLPGIFLLHQDGPGDVAAVGEAFLPDQRRPHVRNHRDPVVVLEIERRHQFDPAPLGIKPAHVEEPEIRAPATPGPQDPRPDRQRFDVVQGDRCGHAIRCHCEEPGDEAISMTQRNRREIASLRSH